MRQLSPVSGSLWEGGHFYSSKGPTAWSVLGWQLLSQLKKPGDHTMVLVDDVHSISLVNSTERNLPVVKDFSPRPCMTVLESAMTMPGLEVLKYLSSKKLSRRHRARKTRNRWCCSGYPLTSSSENGNPIEPLCLLYDLGLAKLKSERGFNSVVNVLPEFYEQEQRALIRIARKAIPDLRIEAVLFDLTGRWRWLRPEDILART
jgi:hypothetical protein